MARETGEWFIVEYDDMEKERAFSSFDKAERFAWKWAKHNGDKCFVYRSTARIKNHGMWHYQTQVCVATCGITASDKPFTDLTWDGSALI